MHLYKDWALYFLQGIKLALAVSLHLWVDPCDPVSSQCGIYSSAKLELLALKWAVTEKLRDYLLGSKFNIYIDNNPLTYVKESKLVVAQIRWLSELALFNFDIKYRSCKLNQAADTLSRYPKTEDENFNNSQSDWYETTSYTVICGNLSEAIKGGKLPLELKRAVQVEITQQVQDIEKINVHS